MLQCTGDYWCCLFLSQILLHTGVKCCTDFTLAHAKGSRSCRGLREVARKNIVLMYTKLFLPVIGHPWVERIVNQVATCMPQWVIMKYTCRQKHLNFISTHWNCQWHFQPPVNWHSFSWSWRAKHTVKNGRKAKHSYQPVRTAFKAPYFHSPFQPNSLGIT